MNEIKTIRAEIEQRRKAQLDKNGNAKNLFCAVRLWAYADLLGLLDIIQEHPVPAEEDEKGFCKDNCKGFQDTGGRCFADGDCKAKQEADLKASIAPAADLEEEIDREIQKLHTAPCYDELRNFARHFYAVGMHAERERMMSGALCGNVAMCGISAWVELPSKELIDYLRSNFKEGDDVRVIIVKKEDEK